MQITDTKLMNNEVFSKGKIQVSPQHLQMLNMNTPTLYQETGKKNISSFGYKIFLTGYADYVLKREIKTYRSVMLRKLITQLQSIPRPIQNGFQLKNSVDTRKASIDAFSVWYKIISGQIVIFNIEVEDEAQKARDRLEKPGLYKIKKTSEGNWVKEFSATKITTNHAAVNGMLNNLNKATWLMGAHLEFEFGKSNFNEFTLFHNPSESGVSDFWESARDKLGFTTEITRSFSKVLQKSQKEGNEVKWVAHSQGGAIFAEGVRYYLNGNSSWAILGGFNGVFKDKEDISLNKHKVAFHGNANNNFRSKFLFDRAGIEVIATRANDYDAVNAFAGFNTLNPMNMIGSIIYAPHLMGSVQQSPHTLAQTQEQWEKNMNSKAGSGRNSAQEGFDAVQSGIRYINNFLK